MPEDSVRDFTGPGLRPRLRFDHNATAVETLEANFGHLGTKALVRDLATFGPEDLTAHLAAGGDPEHFDVIIGGPPCQGWSSVGRGKIRSLRNPGGRKQLDSDPRNELYKNFLRYVEHFQPSVAVMENVPGMLSHSGNNVAEHVARSLSDSKDCYTHTKDPRPRTFRRIRSTFLWMAPDFGSRPGIDPRFQASGTSFDFLSFLSRVSSGI